MAKPNRVSTGSFLSALGLPLFCLVSCHSTQTAPPPIDTHSIRLPSDSAEAAAYRIKAAAGDVESARKLGILYFNADGVPRDYGEACYWFQKSADQGNPEAEDKLGQIFLGRARPADYEAAMGWFKKAAAQGYGRAVEHVGKLYFFGDGVPKDTEQSQVWFGKAFPLIKAKADAGDAENEQALGTMYDAGWGVKKDYAAALACHQKAASQGYSEAYVSLAYMTQSGAGVDKNPDQAENFLKKAADLGSEEAQVKEGNKYRWGRSGSEDFGQALYWYQKAANQGYGLAEFYIGSMYEEGSGVNQDYGIARAWYLKAADHGSSEAENSLGLLYLRGTGVPQDYIQALDWVRKAFEHGNVPARMNVVLFTKYKAAILLKNKDYDGLETFGIWAKSVKPTLCSRSSVGQSFFEGVASVSKALPDSQKVQPFQDWVNARPNSVTAKLALAKAYTEEAWRLRGSGYANSVTDSGWKGFKDNLEQGRTLLFGIKEERFKEPEWYIILQQIALGESWDSDTYFKMANEGIAHFPDEFGIQSEVMVYLLPRWLGSNEALLNYATSEADSVGGEDGDILYARLAQSIWFYTRSTNVFTDLHFDWTRLSHGMDAMCERNPDALQLNSFRAFFACQKQDRAAAKTAFTALHGQFDESVWTSHDSFLKCKAWAEQ